MAQSNVPHFSVDNNRDAIERWCQNAELSQEGVQTLRLHMGENAPAFFQTVHGYTDYVLRVVSSILERTQRLPARIVRTARAMQQFSNQIASGAPLARCAIELFVNGSASLGVVEVLRYLLDTAESCCLLLNLLFELQDTSITDGQGELTSMEGESHTEASTEEYTAVDINPDEIHDRFTRFLSCIPLNCFTGTSGK